MAGRNAKGQPTPSNNDLLLSLDDTEPGFGSGRPPPTDDEHLAQQYNFEDEDPATAPRISVAHDDFVGGSASLAYAGNEPAGASFARPRAPYMSAADNRSYSQSSDLQNYGKYDDLDDVPDDRSMQDFYGSGGLGDSGHTRNKTGAARNRNSILSLGGGMMGRAKNLLGMGPQYSEMDLPLTEPGIRPSERLPQDEPRPAESTRQTSGRKFKFGFGRGKVDYSTTGPRLIYLNNPPANSEQKFVDNYISTTKYNGFTFLPKFFKEQFMKYANVFFLFTAILQQLPNISPTNRWTTVVPLGLVLIVSAIKELVEDARRRTSDGTLNNSRAKVLRGSSFDTVRWIDVSVGDIVKVESEEPFPADLVLLASSEPEGLCYIETANLDGETNLKIKQAIPETADTLSPSELSRFGGRIRSEQPNSSLYTYEATMTMHTGGGEKELPLAPDQLLLRGATLRNTQWVYGATVFTGHETKLMRNATSTPIKKTQVEHMVNYQILMLGAILIGLSIVSAIGHLITNLLARGTEKFAYLYDVDTDPAGTFFKDLLTYWVLYSNLVPISLFVTVEIVKYMQAVLINSDLDIYYDVTNTPASCRTSSLVEELGQVEYVFSDKTGTLTCNQMEFRQCSIAGIQYADEVPEDRKAIGDEPGGIYDFTILRKNLRVGPDREIMNQLLTLLATCHTVIPERRDEKLESIKYQAASPDEGALVEGAVMLGYRFIARRPKSVTILVNGRELEYELLAVCEFNSTRKRMSTIFRCPDGRIRCFTKGADTVILERLSKENPHVEATLQHLEEYASDGLRTLCLAMREIPEQEFQQWLRVFNQAATTVSGNRADELDKAAEIIEHDLTLLGATAIEDKLQDGVPDTIHTLQSAGIKVWVLTGDRQETAINIGMSCKLISEDMTLLIVNEENATGTRDNLEKKLNAIRSQAVGSSELESLALVIDGRSLTYALEKDMEKLFLDLAVMCKAVICCRVSPLQKALVVKLVKRHLKAILLAIGDGANDVSMIQAAHVGVGIAGMEGLQAARSADIAIGQFRYLRKLLLVHGAWSYYRVSKVILYSFYKNIAFFMTQFWYSFNNAFSGEIITESWTLSFYNVLFTVLPPFVIGIFDQFVSARLLDRYPQLYQLSQRGVFFKMHSFFAWVANGFYHSLIIYYITSLIYQGDLIESDGQVSGHWVWGTTMYTVAIVTVLGKLALISNIWTKYHAIALPGSLAVWFIFIPVWGTLAPKVGVSPEYDGVLTHTYPSPVFWLTIIVVPVLCLIRDLTWKYIKRMYRPESYHHVQEIQKYNVQDYRPRMEQFQKAIRKVRQVQRMRKQRGYAFSQTDESQARVLNAYDTTRERGRYGELTSTGVASRVPRR